MGPRIRQAAARLGWIEGRNVAMEYRWAEGRNERYTEIATEFARLKVDVIVTTGTAAVIAVCRGGRKGGSYPLAGGSDDPPFKN
jgi:hypothetical protein